MPSRIIREGIITSEPVNALSERGELFYRRLMSVADDHGKFYSHPSILRAQCFPLKLHVYSDEDVKQMLNECIAVGLVLLYGPTKNYLHIVKFGQQTRSKSKFPQPNEDEMLIICKADGKQMLNLVGVGVGDGDVFDSGQSNGFAAEFKNSWMSRYESVFSRKYVFAGAKDGSAVSRLEKTGLAASELIGLAVKAWGSSDQFTRSVSATIAGFCSRLNNIQAEFAPRQQQKLARNYRA